MLVLYGSLYFMQTGSCVLKKKTYLLFNNLENVIMVSGHLFDSPLFKLILVGWFHCCLVLTVQYYTLYKKNQLCCTIDYILTFGPLSIFNITFNVGGTSSVCLRITRLQHCIVCYTSYCFMMGLIVH